MALEIGYIKDPWSWFTHFVGAIAAVVGLVFLVDLSSGDSAQQAVMTIYGASLVALFSASSIYHFFDLGEKGNPWLRRLDHTAIFLLISGTYTPIFFHTLDGAWRIVMLSLVGGLALLGIVFKLFWINAPRKLSAGMYVAIGWLVLIPGPIVFPRLSNSEIGWFVGGGLVFTLGAVVYARKRPDPWPGVFGFHEIWHIFVLAGAALHYVFVLCFLDWSYTPF